MQDFISEFAAAMVAAGYEAGKIKADDKWHRVKAPGDSKGKLSGTYSLKIVDGDFAIGCFFSRKDPDNKIKWHSKTDKKLSSEERAAIKKRIAEEQERKEQEEHAAHMRVSALLSAAFKGYQKLQDHPYLTRKGIRANGTRLRTKGNEVLIPLYGTDGKIWTIQRITESGKKFLWKGGKKRGCYFPMAGSKENLDTILVCEGFSTGASIREATGLPVIAAIDSGNLAPVCLALKEKYPESRFVICADNDAFTKNPKGDDWNPGLEAARKAAAAIGGAIIAMPDFSGVEGRHSYTDFNDLQIALGHEEVKKQIERILDDTESYHSDEAIAGEMGYMSPDQHPGDGDFIRDYDGPIDYDPADDPTAHEPPMRGDFDLDFKVLGYNDGQYYYFPFKERQIVALSAAAHTLPNLMRLDNLENWEYKFGADGKSTEKKIVMYAANALIQRAKQRGVFTLESRVRGCGAWIDKGRKVLHCGDLLYVDGKETKFDEMESDYTYIAAAPLMRPAKIPLSGREAYALRQICEYVTWENKLSGSLLAGWMVIAPICGALPFRPHVYITGEAESGKSTVMDKIIKPVLGRMSLNLDGGTTEPSVRQQMGYDARPLVYDEAEKSASMQQVIELARKASTGSTVKKFGQPPFTARFAACFSAINPPVNKTADESRISFMTLKKNRRASAMEEYNNLLDMIERTITPDYSARLLARTLWNLDTLFANITTFQRAARRVIRGARASELIGAMVAGLYLLSKTDAVTDEFAQEWISQHDWTNHTIIEEDTDPVRLLQHLSSCLLVHQFGGTNRQFSVGDLIIDASRGDGPADKLLRYNGIAVKNNRVNIAGRSQGIEKMLRDTDWDMKWTRMLLNIEGAEAFKNFYFGVGFKTSGVSLPLELFSDRDPAPLPEQPDMYEEIPF